MIRTPAGDYGHTKMNTWPQGANHILAEIVQYQTVFYSSIRRAPISSMEGTLGVETRKGLIAT